jgi:hypothetical protein
MKTSGKPFFRALRLIVLESCFKRLQLSDAHSHRLRNGFFKSEFRLYFRPMILIMHVAREKLVHCVVVSGRVEHPAHRPRKEAFYEVPRATERGLRD